MRWMTKTALMTLVCCGCAHAPAAIATRQASQSDGYSLAMATFACWLGPVWTEAEQPTAAAQVADAHARCNDVAVRVWGDAEPTRVERLRALEAVAVDDTVLKVKALSATMPDGDRRALEALVKRTADAQRENMWARRASDKIKIDLGDEDRPDQRLTADEQQAIGALGGHRALAALLALSGPFGDDAHALALLAAMDRMELARGLPKHMKVYAVRDAFQLLFAVPPPPLPADVATPLPPGEWLSYLERVATAAGHGGGGDAQPPRARNQLAWGSVLAGFADRLRPLGERTSATMAPVVRATVKRLDAEYIADRNAVASSKR